ncbi:MAG TPA: hypothetical protein VL096_18780 [Pirellulaceae bacterium]|nr:hypothetical protein [Pirellulaceae bacterium]
MSRILQALKQLEARPAAEPSPAPAVAPPATPSARMPTMPFTPPAATPVEQRAKEHHAAPRRKKRKAQRVNPPLPAAMEQLLASFQPSLVEGYAVEELGSPANMAMGETTIGEHESSLVMCDDNLPDVVTIREPVVAVERALEVLDFAPAAIECWSPRGASETMLVANLDLEFGYEATSALIVTEHLPQIVTIRELAALPPAAAAPHEQPAEATSERDTLLAVAELRALLSSVSPAVIECWIDPELEPPLLVEGSHCAELDDLGTPLVVNDYAPEVITIHEPAPLAEIVAPPATNEPEIDLRFERATPRRREPQRKLSKGSAKSDRRKQRRPDERELQVRTAVRGTRLPATVAETNWEASLREELRQPALAARYGQLVARFQADYQDFDHASLLIASLGAPATAAEIALHAALQLVDATDRPVLVIEADNEAALSRRWGLAGKPGLIELLSPQDAHGETIHPTATARLQILPWGRGVAPVLSNLRPVSSLLADLAHEYPWIIVVAGRADAPVTQAFARLCRGTYLAAPLGEVDVASAQRSLALLRNAGACVLGSMVVE